MQKPLQIKPPSPLAPDAADNEQQTAPRISQVETFLKASRKLLGESFAMAMQPLRSPLSAALQAANDEDWKMAVSDVRSALQTHAANIIQNAETVEAWEKILGVSFVNGLARAANHESAANEDDYHDAKGKFTFAPDKSAGHLKPEDARAQLNKGIQTKDVFGNPVTFDRQILNHWEENGYSAEEQDRRLRRLPDAIKAVETPHEVWSGNKQTAYLRSFTDEKSKKRYMAGFVMKDGKARTFFHLDRDKQIEKLRKGDRIYARE